MDIIRIILSVLVLILLLAIGWSWKVPYGHNFKSYIALAHRIAFLTFLGFWGIYFFCGFANLLLEFIKKIHFEELSWFIKVPILIIVGAVLELIRYDKLQKREKAKMPIVKLVIFSGRDDKGNLKEYYSKEIVPANGDKFTLAEQDVLDEDIKIINKLDAFGSGSFVLNYTPVRNRIMNN